MSPLPPPKPSPKKHAIEHRVAGNPKEAEQLPPLGVGERQTYEARRRHRSRGRKHRPARSTVLQRWGIAVCSVTGLAVLGGIVWTLIAQKRGPELPPLVGTAVDVGPTLTPRISAARGTDISRRLLNATREEDVRLLIRPGLISPADALQMLAELRKAHQPLPEPAWLGAGQSQVAPIDRLYLRFGRNDMRMIALTPDDGDRWEVDFDAFARYCEPPAAELLAGHAKEGLVRVVASRGRYFNGHYADNARWLCFSLHFGDTDQETLLAYCPKDGITATAMERVEARNRLHLDELMAASHVENPKLLEKVPFRMTLRIRHEDTCDDPRQWLIAEAVADDWVLGERSFEEIVRQSLPN